jgi:hypothetical protein
MIEQTVAARSKISPSLRFSLTKRAGVSSETTASEVAATGEASETMGRRRIARVVAENFILVSDFGIISKRLNMLIVK